VVELLLRFKLANIPVVVTLHTVNDDMGEQEKTLLKYIIEESSSIIVHETFQRDILVKYFGPSKKYKVIEHGIREIGPVEGAKEKLGLHGKKVILLIGYIRPSKNFHKLVEMFPDIAKQEEDAVLVVAGKSRNAAFDQYKESFYTLIHNSEFSDKIKIFRGQFPQYTFDTILSAADVVVLPYERGAQSGILSQCIAMNIPVVTSGLTAFKNILNRCQAGIVCSNDNDYANNIIRILNDRELRSQFKKSMEIYIKEQAGWEKIASKHVSVYSQLISNPLGKAEYVYLNEPEGYRRY
ncbi:MAG: glycosyltransferase, partial [Bacteroidota bacterium]